MRRFRLPAAVLVFGASFALATAAFANAPLLSFGTGAVTITGDSATITLDPATEFGGVYSRAQALSNRAIGNLDVSFVSTGDVAGGAPRLNVPIDDDGDHMWDYWAVIDAANCGGTSDVPVLVSTSNPDCAVFFLGPGPAATYASWADYAAANPTHRVASKGENSTPFIIADGTAGTYEIEAIDLQ